MDDVLLAVGWVWEAEEARIGWLVVRWCDGGSKLKGVAERRSATVARCVECKVRKTVGLRLAIRRGGQWEPEGPSDFPINDVRVRKGKGRNEEGGDMTQNGLFSSRRNSRLRLREVLWRAKLCVLANLELHGSGS